MHVAAYRSGIDPSKIEDVIVGCVSQTGGQVCFRAPSIDQRNFDSLHFLSYTMFRLATSDATWSWPVSTSQSLYQALPSIANVALLNRLDHGQNRHQVCAFHYVSICQFHDLFRAILPFTIRCKSYRAINIPHPPSLAMLSGVCMCVCQAIHFAAQAVMSGVQDVVIAAGVEVMA